MYGQGGSQRHGKCLSYQFLEFILDKSNISESGEKQIITSGWKTKSPVQKLISIAAGIALLSIPIGIFLLGNNRDSEEKNEFVSQNNFNSRREIYSASNPLQISPEDWVLDGHSLQEGIPVEMQGHVTCSKVDFCSVSPTGKMLSAASVYLLTQNSDKPVRRKLLDCGLIGCDGSIYGYVAAGEITVFNQKRAVKAIEVTEFINSSPKTP